MEELEDNEREAIRLIHACAAQELPPNQLALRSYYLAKIEYLRKAILSLQKEIGNLLTESNRYQVAWDQGEVPYIRTLYATYLGIPSDQTLQYIRYQRGGTRKCRTKKHMKR